MKMTDDVIFFSVINCIIWICAEISSQVVKY